MSASQKRPTISLCLIMKNEAKNINRLLDSVEGCFDEIILVDTGSSDNTKELGLNRGCKVFDFVWIDDFSAARNFAFSKATSDYLMWLDGDDVLKNRENFIQWRDHAMAFADMWLAGYNYALDKEGKPIISFVRERVFRRDCGPVWQYPIHEGIVPNPAWMKDYAVTWSVDHLRDEADIAQDKSRNVTILEKLKRQGRLGARLQFYYGKELYEAGRCIEAINEFDSAIEMPSLEQHDKTLAIQYAAYSCIQLADMMKDELRHEKNKWLTKAIEYCQKGILLDPNRAEFHVAAGDCYIKMGDPLRSIPFYASAKHCHNPKNSGSPYESAIYHFSDSYGKKPSLQLATIYLNMGDLESARIEAEGCLKKFGGEEPKTVLAEIDRLHCMTNPDGSQAPSDDIIFTTPPVTAYSFDEEVYKERALGGSETALVMMAKHLKQKTGRSVKVFNMREKPLVAESGVEYIPNKELPEYLSKYRPAVNIAWRHNTKLTNAPTYLWCHDLITAGVEAKQNFDKMFCLSEFHKEYVKAKQGVPDEKIIVTRNGLSPEKFAFERQAKNPNKIVWMSSPDRGLDRAILVMDKVREEFPEAELHVYNSIENLYKYGPQMSALADHLKGMIAARPWVIYHGFTEQNKLYREVDDAVVWNHPCNFIETYCITAVEMLSLGIYPVTRRLGALTNTLAEAEKNGMATLLDHGCMTDEEAMAYAGEIKAAIREKKWERVAFDPASISWEGLAEEWIKIMGLDAPKTAHAAQASIPNESLLEASA